MRRRRRRATRAQIGAALAAVEDRAEVWARSIPETFTPAQGAAAASAAYDEARNVVKGIALSYRGTVPPPPWPAPPALQEAMRRLAVMRDGLQAFARRVPGQRWPRDTGKVGPALQREGRAVYRELGALVKLAASKPRLQDMIDSVRSPLGMLAIAALVLWAFSERTPARTTRREFA